MDIVTYALAKKYANLATLGLTNVNVEDNTIKFTLSATGEEISMTFDKPKDGLGIKEININENGELIITYTDNTTSNVGQLPTITSTMKFPIYTCIGSTDEETMSQIETAIQEISENWTKDYAALVIYPSFNYDYSGTIMEIMLLVDNGSGSMDNMIGFDSVSLYGNILQRIDWVDFIFKYNGGSFSNGINGSTELYVFENKATDFKVTLKLPDSVTIDNSEAHSFGCIINQNSTDSLDFDINSYININQNIIDLGYLIIEGHMDEGRFANISLRISDSNGEILEEKHFYYKMSSNNCFKNLYFYQIGFTSNYSYIIPYSGCRRVTLGGVM